MHLGQTMQLGLFVSQSDPTARWRVNVTLVGIVVLNNQVVQDDIDNSYGFAVLTPALFREFAADSPASAIPVSYDLQLDRAALGVPAVERELLPLVPRDVSHQFHATAPVVTQVEEAVKPESIALAAFGAIAALVALVIVGQAISRQIRVGNEDRRLLRALGAGPGITVADSVIGVLGAVVLGALAAVGVAVALSAIAPIGPVRRVYPASGIAFDWTVLGWGFAILVVVLATWAFVVAFGQAPHRLVRRGGPKRVRASRVAGAAANAGLPTPAVTGIRFAMEPGSGRTAVPVRSALVGTVVAVVMLVATLTFASGLRTLVTHPRLYGWNWSYALDPSAKVPPQTDRLLDHDPDVAAWSGVDYTVADIDDQTVPVLLENAKPTVAPPILTGHGLDADNQIVIGAATLARLHKHVGNVVEVSYGRPEDAPVYVPPTRVLIVGTATFPAVGYPSLIADHTSMGTGALVSEDVQPPAFRKAKLNSDPTLNGPDLVFVRIARGSMPAKVERICNASLSPPTKRWPPIARPRATTSR